MTELIIKNLTKNYRHHQVFKDVSLRFDSDNYNFLIGENGTGKSTMIKCLLDNIKYQGNIEKTNLSFSYAPEAISLPEYISVYNFLLLLLKSKTKKTIKYDQIINYYLEAFDILIYKKKLICQLSKGTRQKIILIQTLMIDSDVYIFDEPLSGLDIDSRKVFMKELRRLKQKKKLIIICTHYLNEYNFRFKQIFTFPLQGEINECNTTT